MGRDGKYITFQSGVHTLVSTIKPTGDSRLPYEVTVYHHAPGWAFVVGPIETTNYTEAIQIASNGLIKAPDVGRRNFHWLSL